MRTVSLRATMCFLQWPVHINWNWQCYSLVRVLGGMCGVTACSRVAQAPKLSYYT